MCPGRPSRGGGFTKRGKIGEFGVECALQASLEGVLSPNDLEQQPIPARGMACRGQPARGGGGLVLAGGRGRERQPARGGGRTCAGRREGQSGREGLCWQAGGAPKAGKGQRADAVAGHPGRED